MKTDLTQPNSKQASEGLRCNICGSSNATKIYGLPGFNVVRCSGCGLVYSTLPARSDSFEAFYDDEYFTSRDDYFFQNPINNPDVTSESASMQSFRHGLDIIKQYKPGGKLLDVGCAVGVFLGLARDAGFETHGSDISRYAAEHCAAMGHDARCGELETIGFGDETFDVVTLWDVIEHFPDPSRQLQQIRRLLKPDGVLLMDTPNEAGLLRVLARWMYQASLGRFDYPVRKLYHEFHLYYFTFETLEALLSKNGFELILLERSCIPLVKARGNWLERQVVRALSVPERLLHREFELLAMARKRSG